MKRRRSNSRGGGGEKRRGQGAGKESERGNNSSNSNNRGNNKNRNGKTTKKKDPPSPKPPVLGTVATRTRRQQRDIATKWKEPLSILIHIMGFADPDTIRVLCCVSKQFSDLISNDPRMEQNRAIPLLVIRPAKDQANDTGRTGRLLRLLHCHRDKLQRYRTIQIIDVHRFDVLNSYSEWKELNKKMYTLRLYGIVSLDMSSPPPFTDIGDNDLAFYFPSLLPNLREVNLSNNGFYPSCLKRISKKCPNLERITWHNIDKLDINGREMKHAANMKEMYMDNFAFFGGSAGRRALFSDLEDEKYSNFFLFYKCSNKLENVSIRNATFSDYESDGEKTTVVVPQNALIKFVRNVPSLKWFRSNLSHENMAMLRSERPGIEFLN